MQQMICVLLVSASMLSSTGCATIFSGTNQDLEIAIGPEGSKLEVRQWDGKLVAMAEEASNSQKLKIKRPKHRESYIVVASAEGRCPQYWLTKAGDNPLAYLDLVAILGSPLLMAIVFGVELNSGAGNETIPGRFEAELLEASQCAT